MADQLSFQIIDMNGFENWPPSEMNVRELLGPSKAGIYCRSIKRRAEGVANNLFRVVEEAVREGHERLLGPAHERVDRAVASRHQ